MVGGAIPSIFVAFLGYGVGRVTIVDGKFQRHNAVTVVDGAIGVGIEIGRGIVCDTVPCKTIALGGKGVGGVASINGQFQRHHAVAVVNGTIGVCGCGGRSIVGCAVPCESIALGGGGVGGIAGVDSKVERYDAVTVGCIDDGVFCRGVARGVILAVNPCVGVAGGMSVGISGVPTDC